MKRMMILVFTVLLTAGCGATGQVQAGNDYYTQAELDSMLAPVALYPDSVLSHVLIAATYPLEVIQAARWSRERPGLRGEDAVAAVEHHDWDPSVKALVAFPELLARMDEDLDWTQNLGDAFLLQEEDVIASIQYLRSEAYSQGHLRSNEHVRIVREKQYIYIEPARTRVVYVPYYDPRVIYTGWRWHSHPPRYWHRPSGFSLSVNFYWGRPYHVRPSFYFSSFHWPTRKVVVVNHHHHYYNGHRFHSARDVARFQEARHWKHDPAHRRGVSYRGQVAQTRFVESSRQASTSTTRSSLASQRTAARSERRDWAESQRSEMRLDRSASNRGSAVNRSDRSVESRAATSASRGSSPRVAERGSDRSAASIQPNRTVSGRAPERAAAAERSSRSSAPTRSASDRAGRVSESLRGSATSPSRAATTSPARGTERTSATPGSRSPERSGSALTSRSGNERSGTAVLRESGARADSSRQGSSRSSEGVLSPARSRDSSIQRGSTPSRQSAPSRSRSDRIESAPARATPRVQSSAPSRSTTPTAPRDGSRASSAPTGRSSAASAPSRSSRSSGAASSRASAPSRSRGGGGQDRR